MSLRQPLKLGIMWLVAVLFLSLQKVQSFSFSNSYAEEQPGLWSWTCADTKCVRVDSHLDPRDTDEMRYDSLQVCRMVCGKNGSLWPMPLYTSLSRSVIPVNLRGIKFDFSQVGGTTTKIFMMKVVEVFLENLMRECPDTAPGDHGSPLQVHLKSNTLSTTLTMDTDESYQLEVSCTEDKKEAMVQAPTVYGLRHGLETLSQLMGCFDRNLVVMTAANISDAPAFSHRGLLIDTSRNFIPLPALKRTMNGMAASKLNVFHWHATDSHSFPLVSPSVPEFTRFGAYSREEIYSPDDVMELIDYAKHRGIRVLLEIDAPAHAGYGWQWGVKYGFGNLTLCLDDKPWNKYCIQPPCGQLNPINENVYFMLEKLYRDIQQMFPVDMFHMGGDEVYIPCWNSSGEIIEFMEAHNLERNVSSFLNLWSKFQKKALEIWDHTLGNSDTPIVLWSSHLTDPEVIDQYLDKNRYIIETWVESKDPLPKDLLMKGYKLIVATKDSWYLDHGFWGKTTYHDWKMAYDNLLPSEPGVIGGEGAMWTERVDQYSLDSLVWPRTAAIGERLWTNPQSPSSDAEYRLLELRERLIKRGLSPASTTPKWCYQNEGECS